MKPAPDVRPFWLVMAYACNRCGHEVEFYLEEGCEGPRETEVEIPEVIVARGWPEGEPTTGPATATGRMVLPVPFVAAGCPRCQPKMPWDPGGGVLQHVRWSEDRELEPPIALEDVPEEAALFRYPADPLADQACGVPIRPWLGERGG